MDDTPLFKKPWFYIAGWLFVLLALYGWQVYRIGGVQTSLNYILFDLVCIFPLFLLLWVAFFSQFVLPVRTFSQRQKIFDRLLTYLARGHGPALFIKNGEIKEHAGERLKKGPGVVWLDSASAAITRTATTIKQTIGPGVHFLERGEFIAATLDLHIQSQTLGPRESDTPFSLPNDEDSIIENQHVEDRRKQVSAWTRDGIEVVPNISITFRVNTGYPKGNEPGSRFGYRNGFTKKDKANEKADQEAIRKALLGEGINPNINSDSPRHRVAWNQLPGALAVDVWREYVAKYTLDELFKPDQIVPPPPLQIPEPANEEIDPLSQPLLVGASQNRMENNATAMLRQINKLMARIIQWLEGQKQKEPSKAEPTLTTSAPPSSGEPQAKTALWVINDMVKARLTQPQVDFIDDQGKRSTNTTLSKEFELLKNRGLKVLSVNISKVQFHPKIEETMINNWSAVWLKTVEEEKKQIDSRSNILKATGQEHAIHEYAEKLSVDLLRKQPKTMPETLKTLVMRTRAIILENEQLRQRMSEEQDVFEVFEEIIKWMEVNGK